MLLSHTRNRLTAQSTRALMCLGLWSQLSLVKDIDVLSITRMEALEGDYDIQMDVGWDALRVDLD
jgi:hypothetical protein